MEIVIKIITFNSWGGRVGLDAIKKFFEKYQDTDIFCLQEIWQAHDFSQVEVLDQRIVIYLLQQIASCFPDFKQSIWTKTVTEF